MSTDARWVPAPPMPSRTRTPSRPPLAPSVRSGLGQVHRAGPEQGANPPAAVSEIHGIRLSGVRPPRQQRMHHYFEASCDRTPDAVALEWEGGQSTYDQLDRDANRLAHHLHGLGVTPGSRVGLMVPRCYDMFVALLAIQKAGAAWVPIDPLTPRDRVRFIVQDSALVLVVSVLDLSEVLTGLPVLQVNRTTVRETVSAAPSTRPEIFWGDGDPTAYVIYTSGSSGRPKGVDVAQSSICNFLHVITEIYDVKPADRVYQGIAISFDFAIEEVWPTWAVGATLVAGPDDGRKIGAGLTAFLEERGITLLYCVPTVLSTVERTVDSIRAVMVGGEACPRELVERWAPGRRMLNTYGPTEATVTCTWSVLLPGRPVTIGVPVPTYTAVILDDRLQPVPDGEVGELCIGGPGVARGYVNRDDLTADRFIGHPAAADGGKLYRTGDLARVQEDGEIVYLGRADAEVKIRGHRVDLGEIESVLMADPRIRSAAVQHLPSTASGDELAGYLVVAHGTTTTDGDLFESVHQQLRSSLPPYMVPAYLECVDRLPMLTSGKVDRKALGPPSGTRLVGGGEVVPAATSEEEWVRGVWADVLHLDEERLSVTANFFDDLAGHSLVAATVTSRLRRDPRGAGMSVLDLYANPTVRGLARCLGDRPRAVSQAPKPAQPRAGALPIAAFGLAQTLAVFVVVAITMLPISLIYWWHDGIVSGEMIQQIALAFPLIYLGERWLLPLAIARVLGGGLKEGVYRLYGWTHLRVWMVGRSMALAPTGNLAGSAFASAYLRAAGARIGDSCHLGSGQVILPSMLDVDDGVTVGYATHLQGYELREGRLYIGAVHLGYRSTVAANCVLVGPCRVGAQALLREQSTLHGGMRIPDGEVWQGSPAGRLTTGGDPIFRIMNDCALAPREWSKPLRWRFAWGLLALELTPLAAMLPVVVLVWSVLLTFGESWALLVTALTGPVFVAATCVLVLALRRFGLPRTPVGIHHLRSQLGVEKWFADKLLDTSLLLTNTLYSTLYTAPWLRRLGARVGARAEVSTIANIDPDLLTLGEESFVADMASVGSATYCNNHVTFRPTRVGRRSFVGNAAFIPSGTRLGDDTLVGVGSVPPVTGVPDGTSWLGNPPIFLPKREVFDTYGDDQTFRPARRTVLVRYLIEAVRIVLPSSILAVSVFVTMHYASVFARAGAEWWLIVLAVPAVALLCSVAVVVLVALLKWVVVGRYRPRVEPLWSLFVRRTEFVTGIYEAAAVPALLGVLSGTPMLGPLLRLYGVKVGRRSLVDTTYITEFDLVRIGDDTLVGPDVSLQTHLFEDRVMKMDVVDLGSQVTVGTRSVVLYGSEVGDTVRLAPLSLVMKGESLPAGTAWTGIPAQPSAQTSGEAGP